MTPRNLKTLIRWCERKLTGHFGKPCHIEVVTFFAIAYTHKYGGPRTTQQDSQLISCHKLFVETGKIPLWVEEYAKHVIETDYIVSSIKLLEDKR